MQILVVVANTEGSNFWAEVEQGFHRTIFGMKLVGPKDGGESHIKPEKSVATSSTSALRKGSMLISMHHCSCEMRQRF